MYRESRSREEGLHDLSLWDVAREKLALLKGGNQEQLLGRGKIRGQVGKTEGGGRRGRRPGSDAFCQRQKERPAVRNAGARDMGNQKRNCIDGRRWVDSRGGGGLLDEVQPLIEGTYRPRKKKKR